MTSTVEAQKIVLGTILMYKEAQDKIESQTKPQYFTDENCKTVYLGITNLHNDKKPIDIMSLGMYFKKNKPEFTLHTMATTTQSFVPIERFDEYCLVLQDEYIRTEIIEAAKSVLLFAAESHSSGIEIADKLQKKIAEISSLSWNNEKVISNVDLINRSREQYLLEAEAAKNGVTPGITTGSRKMDEHTGGWHNGDLIILSGRPGMGKSRAVIQMIRAAANAGKSPLFFSLEMTEENVNDIMIIGESFERINPKDLRSRTLNERQMEHKAIAEGFLLKKPYYISGERQLSQIKAISRRFVRDNGTGIIFVDFLQKVEPIGKHFSPVNAVSEVAVGLKNLAKDLNIPVVSIASLSRKVEDRGGLKQPENSDLRESGTIESEADMILHAWRPAHYEFTTGKDGEQFVGNEFFWLNGKGRFTEAANILLYSDRYLANFYDEPIEITQKAFNTLQPSTNFYESTIEQTPF
jgi:replicative DNA helicase